MYKPSIISHGTKRGNPRTARVHIRVTDEFKRALEFQTKEETRQAGEKVSEADILMKALSFYMRDFYSSIPKNLHTSLKNHFGL